MKFRMKVLIVAVAVPLSAGDSKPESQPAQPTQSTQHHLSCEDRVTVQSSVITALRAENETLNLRLAALSQLLTATQRRETDQKAQAAILETEGRVLSGMGLSVTDCQVNLDGSVDCKAGEEVEE